MTPAEWLASARADAERRHLHEIVPVLQALADAIARLRADDPDGIDAVRTAQRPASPRS